MGSDSAVEAGWLEGRQYLLDPELLNQLKSHAQLIVCERGLVLAVQPEANLAGVDSEAVDVGDNLAGE